MAFPAFSVSMRRQSRSAQLLAPEEFRDFLSKAGISVDDRLGGVLLSLVVFTIFYCVRRLYYELVYNL